MLPHRGSPPAPRSCAGPASARRLPQLTERDTPKDEMLVMHCLEGPG